MRWAVMGFALLTSVAVAESPESFEDCERLVREQPGELDGYDCIAGLPRKNGQWDDARRRLGAYLAVDPDNHAARVGLAALESSQGRDVAEALFVEAIEGLAGGSERVTEVRARLSLAVFYFIRGRWQDGEAQLEPAAEVAAESGDRVLLARVRNIQGRAAEQRNELGRAWLMFKEVEAQIVPDGPAGMQGFCLSMLGILATRIGRLDEAMDYHGRAAAVQQDSGDAWAAARSRGNLAEIAMYRWNDGALSKSQAELLVTEALNAARSAGTGSTESRMLAFLGVMTDGEAALESFDAALAGAREIGDSAGVALILRLRALALAGIDGRVDEALQDVDRALEQARRNGDRNRQARSLMVRSAIHVGAGDRESAAADLQQAIDVVEAARDLQKDELVQSRFFGEWVTVYERLVGLLLDVPGGEPSLASIEAAFAVGERMRARTLLDALDTAGVTTALAPGGPLQERREEVLGRISEVQKSLLDVALPESERGATLAELERLEREEQTARAALAEASPGFAALRAPVFPELNDVRAALAPNEALLSFQVAVADFRSNLAYGPRGGGSWLMVLTRDESRVYPLPDRMKLTPAVEFFPGLLARRDGTELSASTRLYEMLLADAIRDLDETIDSLVLVPDGPLHHLPFGLLRESLAEDPLGSRFRLTRVPSATTWLRWRYATPAIGPRRAMVLADPLVGDGGDAVAVSSERAATLGQAANLGPLPHARREGTALARRLDDSLVLIGELATEARVKQADMRQFGVLHFAAHAVIDPDHPARSSVLLAADATDDGLLQIREIVDLRLDGGVVVLSACSGASGEVLRGEGVMGLSRAFFQAGARGVVANLWPVRDDEAALFFEAFYDRLAGGGTLSRALARAQADRRRAGAPAAAWAGFVVLGEGTLSPIPGSRVDSRTKAWGAAIALLGGIVLLVLWSRRRAGR